MELIKQYFGNLSPLQIEQFSKLKELYTEWNEKINVISRKDIDSLYEKHVLHSLSIARFIKFKTGTELLDIGTGGGFPSIPLAIFFPEIKIIACDSIQKKITVVTSISEALELQNIQPICSRAEQLKCEVDFVVNRAVEPLFDLHRHTYKFVKKGWFNDEPNGMISLKGGDLNEEIQTLRMKIRNIKVRQIPIKKYFQEPFFETKSLIYHTVTK